MADNTAQNGTSTIATDEIQVGGTQALAHVQFVKLVDGTLNGTDAIPGTAASGLLVNTELPAAAALADAAANPTTPIAGAALLEFNGSTWDRSRSTVAANANATSAATTWTMSNIDKQSSLFVQASAWGSATVVIEGTVDGSNWFAMNLVPVSTGVIATSITAAGSWQVDIAGLLQVRARCSTFVSGTNTVYGRTSPGGSLVSLDNPIPAGTNVIGALSANQSVNIAQIGGGTVTTGNGTAAGAQRVSIASDSTGQVALAAGTNAVGKLTANSGVIIGDVNVVSQIPGTGATAIGKAEDAAAASGDTGVAVFAVRRDTPSSDVSAAGDYASLQVTANGELWVAAGTNANSLGKAEDAVAASGDTGVMMLGVRTDTPATTTSASGDYHPFEIDANGALWTHPIQPSFRIESDSAGLTTATTAYTAGDTAGTELTLANAARVSGWGGVITGASLLDKSNKVNAIGVEFWLFKAASTPSADNAAADWSDANMANFVGIITFDTGSWKINTSNSINTQQNLNLGYGCSATSLFGTFVLRGVPAGNFFSATTDLRIVLHMLRD